MAGGGRRRECRWGEGRRTEGGLKVRLPSHRWSREARTDALVGEAGGEVVLKAEELPSLKQGAKRKRDVTVETGG